MSNGAGSGGIERLGVFGHHPDPRIDYEVEIDVLEGMAYDRVFAGKHPNLEDRIRAAMDFQTLNRPGELRWLSNRFNGTNELYALKPGWAQWLGEPA